VKEELSPLMRMIRDKSLSSSDDFPMFEIRVSLPRMMNASVLVGEDGVSQIWMDVRTKKIFRAETN
jgi:hypothetical protein